MCRRFRSTVSLSCALALLVCLRSVCLRDAAAQELDWLTFETDAHIGARPASDDGARNHTAAMPIAADMQLWDGGDSSTDEYMLAQAASGEEVWISPPDEGGPWNDATGYPPESQLLDDSAECYPPSPGSWCWQAMPEGLIYRSYWAGVHEPRLGIVAMHESGSQSYWDGTLGGRVGLLRYGTVGPIYPQGWQLDVEAAGIVRLTLDEIRDFEMADYRVGVPLTYGIDNWQFKFAVYHLSSHLGDEPIIEDPSLINERINYVRDAAVIGASWYPNPMVRLYSEAAYAVNVDGGAKPWEFQFGTEVSRPGPTGLHGTPFWAVNAHLREEHDFGGDITTHLGWLWRGRSGQVTRAGLHYFNGKSSQYQVFDEHEEQVGFGLWYDY